jgi:uncharacterized protein
MDAIELEAAGPAGPLKGTLVAPADGKPVVLIIPGSGPTDRDGNNPLGVKAAPYRLLAEGLTERGIGSLRIDKRGMFGSAAAIADANAVTIAGYADDITAWIDVLRQRTGAECVWLAGHSEGGLIALAASQGTPDRICGLALIATPGRPLGTVLRDQLRANPANAPLLPEAEGAIDALERGERVDMSTMHPALQGLFAPPVQGFLIDLFAHDPAAQAAASDVPMLLLFGGKDLQTGPREFEALRAARPDAAAVMLPEVNHVLKRVEGDDPAANLATYADPALPLAPGVVEALAAFVSGEAG